MELDGRCRRAGGRADISAGGGRFAASAVAGPVRPHPHPPTTVLRRARRRAGGYVRQQAAPGRAAPSSPHRTAPHLTSPRRAAPRLQPAAMDACLSPGLEVVMSPAGDEEVSGSSQPGQVSRPPACPVLISRPGMRRPLSWRLSRFSAACRHRDRPQLAPGSRSSTD